MDNNTANSIGVGLVDILGALSEAMDLLCPAVVDHHRRVAFIAHRLGQAMGASQATCGELLLSGLTHDVGAFAMTLPDRLDTLRFDTENVSHAQDSWRVLSRFPGFSRVAEIARRHHDSWTDLEHDDAPPDIRKAANIILLADRVDILARSAGDPKAVGGRVAGLIKSRSGNLFDPRGVEAFSGLASSRRFWDEALSPNLGQSVRDMSAPYNRLLDLDELTTFTRLFAQLIDFRSRFTATHSRGVAATASALFRLMGNHARDCKAMSVAGDLHDLGKLAIPLRIINKPGKFTAEERRVMERHALYVDKILGPVSGMDTIHDWASQHHERVNGSGYPHNKPSEDLSMGAKAMAVADVFTALTEDRPYRRGLDREKVMGIMSEMAAGDLLDLDLAELAHESFAELDGIRRRAQTGAWNDFCEFKELDTEPLKTGV